MRVLNLALYSSVCIGDAGEPEHQDLRAMAKIDDFWLALLSYQPASMAGAPGMYSDYIHHLDDDEGFDDDDDDDDIDDEDDMDDDDMDGFGGNVYGLDPDEMFGYPHLPYEYDMYNMGDFFSRPGFRLSPVSAASLLCCRIKMLVVFVHTSA